MRITSRSSVSRAIESTLPERTRSVDHLALHTGLHVRRENENSKRTDLEATRSNLEASSPTVRPNDLAHDFSRIPVHAPERAARLSNVEILRNGPDNPPPDKQTFEQFLRDRIVCDSSNSKQIKTAVNTAKSWVGTAILLLDRFRTGGLSGDQETVVRVALRENFNITDPFPRFSLTPEKPLDTISTNLKTIQHALNESLKFYCLPECMPGELAFVFRNPEETNLPKDTIYFCSVFFGCDPLMQASTVIHERAHESLDVRDQAYERDASYDLLPTGMALENPDSYAVLARQIFHNGLHRPGLRCNAANSRIPPAQLSDPTLQMPPLQEPALPPPPEL